MTRAFHIAWPVALAIFVFAIFVNVPPTLFFLFWLAVIVLLVTGPVLLVRHRRAA